MDAGMLGRRWCPQAPAIGGRATGRNEASRSTTPPMFLELQTANCWFNPLDGCTILLWWWQGITMELRSAFSTSSEASLLSKHITYSITAVSQGSVILPSLVNPNSSCDNFRSSTKTVVWRYMRGISNRFPSEEWTMQLPFPATMLLQDGLISLSTFVILLRSIAPIPCHFLDS
ncbi:hypothetical protein GQ55_6G284200 [Panicum hallii var. hallii]|uniref:Uncharacterized protein n=1 Tax=Panicum hallii var. hallii TaxID=1504633 RepID=A0A2T7DAR7_9POAL|nr:hypothetical protein GQ55_6G284200 [Panicum hallii var. hallii]